MSDLDRITTIVPLLPPSINGLGDYGLILAKKLRQNFGLETEFVVGEPNWPGEACLDGFTVKQVSKRSKNALLELLPNQSNSKVFLHYVGYGYAKRGCPVWLVEALEQWRKAEEKRNLIIMFHEIYAFGAIWTSQFWTSPLQGNLAARLICLSDQSLTSKQGYAEIISKLSQGKHKTVPALPVFSNVGEPEYLTPLSARPRRLVVFGGRGWRSRVYKRSQLALQRTCQELEIVEILDIGVSLDFQIDPVNGIAVICLGVQSSQEISKLLSSSIVGFFDYPTEFLAKSTIFAAYCAHGLLSIGVSDGGENVDGLEAGKHYWLGDKYEQPMNLSAGQIVADNGYAWYQQHQLSVQADHFMTYLRD